MNRLKTAAAGLLAGTALCAQAGTAFAAGGIPHLDHVFLIMLENHGYVQLIGNPYAPFVNEEAKYANLAKNYFAVAHPSLTNYLEVIGGSNFGITDDNSPDWHNAACQPNIVSGVNNNEANPTPICPIAGSGMDVPTPAIDYSNETSGPPGVINVDGIVSYAAAPTTGAMIGDQLVAAGKSWRTYQESLPPGGADLVDYADGTFSNLTQFTALEQSLGETNANVVNLYAAKHNPFAYFASVQSGTVPHNTLANTAGFDGPEGLYADLATGHVPNFAFIAPNQCDDQHGRGNNGPFCLYDPNDNGTQNGLNPGLIQQGDIAVRKIVTAIKKSPAWAKGTNAIVIVWDEDDYSIAPTVNQVALIVDMSNGPHHVRSPNFYTHFNLLNSLESGFGLPCLNHACDASAAVMKDMF